MSDPPMSPPPPSSVEDDSTNTLILTGLSTELFVPDFLRQLRGLFASYGEINQWVPLRSLARIIIVYLYDEDSARAKHGAGELLCDETIGRYELTPTSHRCVLSNRRCVFYSPKPLRVYFADRSPIRFDASAPDVNYLKVPELEKNFLISPPGSPPVGWEPVREDPPNPTPLADDIMAALRHLQLMQKSPGMEMLLHPDEGSGIGISVEDCGCNEEADSVEEVDWNYGEPRPSRNKWKPTPTVLPPLRAAVW
jgi:Calcipressin